MVTALCFVQVTPQEVNKVATAIARIRYVRTVYTLTGEIDLVAVVEVPDLDSLSDVVTEQIADINGVISTHTHIAFRTFDPDLVGAGFAIGG